MVKRTSCGGADKAACVNANLRLALSCWRSVRERERERERETKNENEDRDKKHTYLEEKKRGKRKRKRKERNVWMKKESIEIREK